MLFIAKTPFRPWTRIRVDYGVSHPCPESQMNSEILVSLRRQHSRDVVYDSSSSKTVHGFADNSDEDHRLTHRAS